MTCIVGVEDADGVWIGGDAAAVEDSDLHVYAAPKVFRVGDYLIGFSESFRVGQLIQYRLQVPVQRCADDLEHLATVFVDRLRELLHKGGVAKASADEELQPGALLIGYRRRLYCVDGDYHVASTICGYQAIGCGAPFALGSLHSTDGTLAAGNRVHAALQAAAAHSTGVAPPFTIQHI